MNGVIKIAILLFVTVAGCSFTLFDSINLEHPYPFAQEISINSQHYIYYLCGHLKYVVLYWIILLSTKKYKKEVSIFLIFSVLDLVDYVLRYNTAFFYIADLKINLDLCAICVETLVFFYAMIKYFLHKQLKEII